MDIVTTVHNASFHRAELVLVILLAMTVVGIVLTVLAARLWHLVVAALLLVVSGVWLLVDHPIEGSVLVTFTSRHGLTSGDLLALPASALAVALAVRWFTGRRQQPSNV